MKGGGEMRRKLLIVPVVFVLLYFVVFQSKAYEVLEVKDGDSIILSNHEEIRLAHIDCPEYDQPWGDKATEFVTNLCLHKEVRLKRYGKDKYGRTIAEVFLDETNVNHELVKEGLAWHYRRYSSDKYYQQLELEARAKKKGLWSTKHIAPWNWRGGSR